MGWEDVRLLPDPPAFASSRHPFEVPDDCLTLIVTQPASLSSSQLDQAVAVAADGLSGGRTLVMC